MNFFVTGTNRGLGLVLTRLIAQKGHIVFSAYHPGLPHADIEKLAKEFPSNIVLVPGDVTDEGQMREAAAKVKAACGKLDGIISLAGVLMASEHRLPITDVDAKDLLAALNVNVVGAALVIKHFHTLVKDGGVFLTITSEGGSMTNIGLTYPAYSVTKAAENKLVAIFAKTGQNYSIYAVHPGRMNTEMGREFAQIEPEVSAEALFAIVSGAKKIPESHGWFINYSGDPMEI